MMADRRPTALLLLAGAAALTGVILMTAQPLVSGGESFGHVRDAGVLLLAVAGAGVLAAMLLVEPAWPLSISVVLMSFSGNWTLVGTPVALDRVVLAVGLISLLVRAGSVRDVFGREPSLTHVLIA